MKIKTSTSKYSFLNDYFCETLYAGQDLTFAPIHINVHKCVHHSFF